jgi:hypothetical protein
MKARRVTCKIKLMSVNARKSQLSWEDFPDAAIWIVMMELSVMRFRYVRVPSLFFNLHVRIR